MMVAVESIVVKERSAGGSGRRVCRGYSVEDNECLK